MRARPLAPALALAAALAACGDSLVDHAAVDLRRGPGSGLCSGDAPVSCSIGGADVCKIEGTEFCGIACTDCRAVVPTPPVGAVAACLPRAPGDGVCGYECTGGLLKCADGCCGVTALAAGAAHTCAVTSAGGLYCWGRNDVGQVTGSTSSGPVPTPLKRYDAGVVAVAAGVAHTCAAFADGQVRCWGRNDQGQAPQARSVPGVTALAAGAAHTCALAGGAVSCWGRAAEGQNGGGGPIAAGAAAIAAGANHTCAIVEGGAVVCWGSRAPAGQLGDGGVDGFSASPVLAIPAAQGASLVAASGNHTCVAAANPSGGDATFDALRCWGDAPAPGFGLAEPQPTPAVPREDASKVAVDFRVTGLATGGRHVCVRKGIEGLKCLGPDPSLGALGGLPAPGNEAEALDVPLSAGADRLAAGDDHTCAVFPGGGVRCWGSNAAGQLGDATTVTPGLAGDLRPLGTPVTVSGR